MKILKCSTYLFLDDIIPIVNDLAGITLSNLVSCMISISLMYWGQSTTKTNQLS